MACLDEPTVLAFVGGRVAGDGIDEHLASCRECRDLVVAAARTTFASGSEPVPAGEAPAPAAGIERYAITGLVGTGGQALVYTAHDTVLERTIALKILRDAQGTRILDEARLVAKLDHPNIVAVHDAGTTTDGQLYLAMEYAAGGSLDHWVRGPRDPREVLAACVEAGRGLARAHAAGVVHRDVKPANILLGSDGHARIGDFGLATGGDAGPRIAGTLAYMAPEQARGEATSASDQFALAVTIWEALTGELPFPATGDGRAAAIAAGVPTPPRSIPRHVRAALARALDAAPARRWPTIDAFVDAIAADPRPARRRTALGAGVLAIAAAGVVVLVATRRPPRSCASAGVQDAWTRAARAQLETAFAASHRPYAPAALAAAIAGLDRYAAAWSVAHRQACEATADGQQTTEVLDVRNRCLDERRTALAATVETLAAADDAVVAHATDIVHALPAIAPCADLAWLGERVRPPTDPVARARAAVIDQQIAESTALLRAGKFADAAAAAKRAADVTIDHAPSHARALLALARAKLLFGAAAEADRLLEEAAQLALRGRDDRTAAEAWIELVKAVGHGEARYDEALRYAGFADASIARLGGDRELAARLDYYRCAVFDLMSKLPEAEAACTRARTQREAAFGGDAPEIADVLVLEARLAIKRGRPDQAVAAAGRGVAIREHAFGPQHPSLIEVLFAEGQAAVSAGKLDDAEHAFARGVAIAKGAYGDDSLVMAALLSEQASLAHARGKLADALAAIDRADAIREKLEGPAHADLVFGYTERGRILDDLQRPKDAVVALEHARAIAEQALGDRHPSLSAILQDLGRLHGKLGQRALARQELDRAIAVAGDDPVTVANATSALAEYVHASGAPREAVPIYQRALAGFEQIYGKDAPQLVPTLQNLGLAELDVKAPALAVPLLERAIRLETARSGERSADLIGPLSSLGDAHLALGDRAAARATWQRALALADVEARYPDEVRALRAKLR